MTAKEYDRYVELFEAGMKREGVEQLCVKTDPDTEDAVEQYFSWAPCHICQRPIGGDRIDCDVSHTDDDEIGELSVCVDCYYFAEYGRLDDTTMALVHLDRQQNPAPAQEE